MAEARTGSRRGRVVGLVVVALLFFIIVVYFIATSGWFLKKVILPRANRSLNATVTVETASIHPFSGVALKRLKVVPHGREQLLEAESVVVRYHLGAILRGNLKVDEVTLVNPVITLVEKADGSSNLDPLNKKKEPGQPAPPAPKKEKGKPTLLDIKNVSLRNGTLRRSKEQKEGHADTLELSDLQVTITRVANNAPGKFQLSANTRTDSGEKTNHVAFSGKARASFDYTLGPDLVPVTLAGNGRSDILTAEGEGADLKGLSIILESDLSPTEIKNFSLRFQKENNALGRISINGPFSLEKQEGTLNLAVSDIDRQVLNLVGAKKGWDFDQSRINSTNRITLTGPGKSLTAQGIFRAAQFSIKEKSAGTPPSDVALHYEVEVNPGNKTALIKTFDLRVLQGQREVVRGLVDQPMSIAYGAASNSLPQSSFQLLVQKLNLPDWKAFLGETIESGVLDLKGNIRVAGSGEIKLDAVTALENLTMNLGSNQLQHAQMKLTLAATAIRKDPEHQQINGNFRLEQFSGRFSDYAFVNYAANFDFDLGKAGDRMEIRRAKGSLGQGRKEGGGIELAGHYESKTKTGQIELKLVALNENALGPFVGPALKEKRLASIALEGSLSALLSPGDSASVKADLKVAKLSVYNPQTRQTNPPLSAGFKLDGSRKSQLFDLNTLEVTLSPTDRAKNVMQIKGQVDLSQSSSRKGRLALQSESFDITPYYNLLGEPPPHEKNQQPAAGEPPGGTPKKGNEEPPPLPLPLHEFELSLDIRHFFLREIDITGLKASGKIAHGTIQLNPLEMSINGAPVKASADIDLSKTGYVYAISFNATQVPLEPIANSFIAEKKGQYKGSIFGDGQIRGAGLPGINLRKNLGGHLNLNFTNANIQVIGPKLRRILVPIATLLRVSDITESPLNWIDLKMGLGNGNIALENVAVESEAFKALTRGKIPIADIFTNSPLEKLPVNFQLRRSLAQKSNLLPPDAAPDAKYVALPDFVKLAGTIGQPKSDINELALGGLLLRSTSGVFGGKAGGVLQGVGGILTGQPVQTTPNTNGPTSQAATNNAGPATNKFNAIDLLRGILQK